MAPLAPGRYRVQFTASASMPEEIRQAQDLLGHRIPDGDLAAVFGLALKALIEKLLRDKCAAAARPRPGGDRNRGSGNGSRHIPAAIRREVWKRDQGQCAFIGRNGRRCGERKRLEFHHRTPYALGGPATSANIEIRCRVHNQYESELLFGRRPEGGRRGGHERD